ncbi:hypothetical protein [Halalkalibacter sp. APA_J-10(15)]|uniref:hypothetical protein n=1 Tax=unclassified Halalkalibacter TaxID=2893063 RepID=UPI001FF268EF|nr:hypothetical protein [Halalkalibacter sp. APA_J-10(15)]MCK0472465.1 hypothetical protein [Halalkalibacter sp. APA_J-10(15)]
MSNYELSKIPYDWRIEAIAEEFTRYIGNRAFILVPQFPFMYIGVILDVVGSEIIMDVERTQIEQLENRIWQINIDTMQVFYIERGDGWPTIPEF